MTEAQNKTGRPATTARRRKIARDLLEIVVREELKVADGREPRGHSSMTRFLSALQREIANKHKVSLRWVQQSWKECREAAIQRAAAEIAGRLDVADKFGEADQRQRRMAEASNAAPAPRKVRS